MLLPSRIYIALGPWHFEDFCKIFLPNIGEDQKTTYDFNSGTLAGTASYYDRSGPDQYIRFTKRLDVILR